MLEQFTTTSCLSIVDSSVCYLWNVVQIKVSMASPFFLCLVADPIER